MPNIVSERIRSRLEALGKNPSSVALEAGLGRSSVRDIITGRVSSSRLDTLRRLTGPLECTLDYLTGDSDDPAKDGVFRRHIELDVFTDLIPTPAEAGVFRPVTTANERRTRAAAQFSHRPYHTARDYRLPTWDIELFEMVDESQAGIGIVRGDVVKIAKHHLDMQIPLTEGSLVAVRRALNSPSLEEVSIRQVKIAKDGISLICSPKSDRVGSIDIPEHSIDNESKLLPNFYPVDGGSAEILGLAVEVVRQLPIADPVHDLSFNDVDE